jgi:hypothetical protein
MFTAKKSIFTAKKNIKFLTAKKNNFTAKKNISQKNLGEQSHHRLRERSVWSLGAIHILHQHVL